MIPARVAALHRVDAPGSLVDAVDRATARDDPAVPGDWRGSPAAIATDLDHTVRQPLTLRRAWPRDDGHLLLDFMVPGGTAVAGQWFGDRSRPDGIDHDRLDRVARQTTRTAPCPHAVDVDHDHGLLLQAAGADRRLPALAGLVKHPDASLVVHRPERRAVVRLADPVRWAKVVRPHRVHDLVAPDDLTAFTVPQRLSRDDARGVTVWSTVPGRPLHDLLASGEDRARLFTIGHALGTALRQVHERPEAVCAAAHTAADELAVVDTWCRRLAAHRDDDPIGLHVPLVEAAFAASSPAPRGVLHRDLHDKQVLVDGDDGIGLLDFDTMAYGERVLDLANLLVHLQLRTQQGRIDQATADGVGRAVLDGYGWTTGGTRRLLAHAAATRLRLAAVYAFRPRWPDVPHALVATLFDPPPGLA